MAHEPSLTEKLFELRDDGYADFTAKLVPTVERERIIGVRIPALRKLAKSAAGTQEAAEFLSALPHRLYDENNLHAALLMHERDVEVLLAHIEKFLPHIDNWATCDLLSPPAFTGHPERVYECVKRWLDSGHTYTVRFGVTTLLGFYLGEHFSPEHPRLCAELQSSEYYINMAIAWYFAEGLARRPDDFLPFFENGTIVNPWVRAKALQKARESRRVPRELLEKLGAGGRKSSKRITNHAP